VRENFAPASKSLTSFCVNFLAHAERTPDRRRARPLARLESSVTLSGSQHASNTTTPACWACQSFAKSHRTAHTFTGP
jgi:hypothetical protein